MGHRALCGITRVRTASVVAFRDSARFASLSARNRLIPGSTPAVDTVTWRGESPGKTSVRPRTAARTSATLSSGSPMPMKTTLRGGHSGSAAAATRYWRTISPARRLRPAPSRAVAQKSHRRVQPACEETQTVLRPRPGIRTVSTVASPRPSASLIVPSALVARETSLHAG